MLPADATVGWSDDWIWGISLIALSMVTHAAGLALISDVDAKVPPTNVKTA